MLTLARLDALSLIIESIRSHYSVGNLWLLKAEKLYQQAQQALIKSENDFKEVYFIELIDRYKPSSELSWLESMFENALGVLNLDVFELLLIDGRVDFSQNENKAIRWASECGSIDAVTLLLRDPRVDPSAFNNYAIRSALENGHKEIVDLLKPRCKLNFFQKLWY